MADKWDIDPEDAVDEWAVDPADSAMMEGAPASTIPSTPEKRSDSWLQRTGDRAAQLVEDTLMQEFERLKSPSGIATRAAEATLPLMGQASTAGELAEDLISGKAPDDYLEFFKSLPGAAKMAFSDPGEFFGGAVAGAAGDLAGLGARGRVRGEKFLGDTLQMLGYAAPLTKMPTPKPHPRLAGYGDALEAGADAKRGLAKTEGQLELAERELRAPQGAVDEATDALERAKHKLNEARQAKDDFGAQQAEREYESVLARETNNPARQQMRGAQGRTVDLERQLNAAVDDAFGSGQLSRQQKIALYDALQGKRLPDDLPPDLLDLAERLRESRIDADRFRAASLTDEVRDPMSQHGLARTGPEAKALNRHVRQAAAEKRRASTGLEEAKAGLDPLKKNLEELQATRRPHEDTLSRFKSVAENIVDNDALTWLVKQPAEGLLASKIGPTQMKAAAWLSREMSKTHPKMLAASMTISGAGGGFTEGVRTILDTHAELMANDPGYAARFYEVTGS